MRGGRGGRGREAASHAPCLMPHASCLTYPCRKSCSRDPPSHTCALPSQRLDWRSKEIDMTSNDVIALDSVSKTYRLGRIRVRALEDVTLTIGRGDFIAIAGPSGSGKTTLLNLIGCIDKPDSGRIVIDDVDVTRTPLHRLSTLRLNTLGFIFQTFNLIPVLSAYENVEYPLLLQNVSSRQRAARVRRWLAAGRAHQRRRDWRPERRARGLGGRAAQYHTVRTTLTTRRFAGAQRDSRRLKC